MQSFKKYLTESQTNVFTKNSTLYRMSQDTIDYIIKQYPNAIHDNELAKFVIKITSHISGHGYRNVTLTPNDIDYYKKTYPKLFQVPKNQNFAYRGLSLSAYESMGKTVIKNIIDIIHKKYNTITHESTLHGVKFDGILQNFLHKDRRRLQSWTVNENVAWRFAAEEERDDYLGSSMKYMVNDVLGELKYVKNEDKISKRLILENLNGGNVPCILETHIDKTFFMNPELSNTFENSYNESEVIRYSNKPLKCNLWIPTEIVQVIKELLDKMDE